jgi:hypothetical protein
MLNKSDLDALDGAIPSELVDAVHESVYGFLKRAYTAEQVLGTDSLASVPA